MTDLAPIKERLAKCIRLFGKDARERANARTFAERALTSIGASWTDLGDWIEHSYSEDEMREFEAAVRKEERARAPQSNGHYVLPEASEMAEYCHERLSRLKDDAQRKFINQMYLETQQGINPPRGPLGYLASLYIKTGGKIS